MWVSPYIKKEKKEKFLPVLRLFFLWNRAALPWFDANTRQSHETIEGRLDTRYFAHANEACCRCPSSCFWACEDGNQAWSRKQARVCQCRRCQIFGQVFYAHLHLKRVYPWIGMAQSHFQEVFVEGQNSIFCVQWVLNPTFHDSMDPHTLNFFLGFRRSFCTGGSFCTG